MIPSETFQKKKKNKVSRWCVSKRVKEKTNRGSALGADAKGRSYSETSKKKKKQKETSGRPKTGKCSSQKKKTGLAKRKRGRNSILPWKNRQDKKWRQKKKITAGPGQGQSNRVGESTGGNTGIIGGKNVRSTETGKTKKESRIR